jgi:hypothetical protein
MGLTEPARAFSADSSIAVLHEPRLQARTLPALRNGVCTENLNPGVVVMESA